MIKDIFYFFAKIYCFFFKHKLSDYFIENEIPHKKCLRCNMKFKFKTVWLSDLDPLTMDQVKKIFGE
jgi:hypothetical protein